MQGHSQCAQNPDKFLERWHSRGSWTDRTRISWSNMERTRFQELPLALDRLRWGKHRQGPGPWIWPWHGHSSSYLPEKLICLAQPPSWLCFGSVRSGLRIKEEPLITGLTQIPVTILGRSYYDLFEVHISQHILKLFNITWRPAAIGMADYFRCSRPRGSRPTRLERRITVSMCRDCFGPRVHVIDSLFCIVLRSGDVPSQWNGIGRNSILLFVTTAVIGLGCWTALDGWNWFGRTCGRA